MSLHRTHGNSQLSCYFLVTHAFRQQRQYVGFPRAQRLLGGLWLGVAELTEQGLGDAGAEVGAALIHGLHRQNQLFGWHVLEDVARSTRLNGFHHVFAIVVHGDDQNTYFRQLFLEGFAGFQATGAGHGNVHQYHVWHQSCGAVEGSLAVGNVVQHLNVVLAFQADSQAFAYHRVVVGNDQADGCTLSGGIHGS